MTRAVAPPAQLESARLRGLAAAVAAGERHTLDAFWAAVERVGTPLIEPCADPRQRLVTFLWRDPGDTHDVVVVGGPTCWDRYGDDRMSLLPGTDVWFRSYRADSTFAGSYRLSPNDSLVPPDDVTDWAAREVTFCADPLNRQPLEWPDDPDDPASTAGAVSWMALPDAPDASILAARRGIARGRLAQHAVPSAELGTSRRVWVHVPPAQPTGLLLLLDGQVWAMTFPIAALLDNLRVDGTTGSLLVAMVDSGDGDTRMRELSCHEPFARFLTGELVPWLRDRWDVPRGPGSTALMGQSLGGLTAAFTALTAPSTFGTAICQSGSFWWPRDELKRPTRWLAAQVRERPVAPVRFRLEVGDLEGADMLPSNRAMRDALVESGYAVDYSEFRGGHDYARWRLGMATALAGFATRR